MNKYKINGNKAIVTIDSKVYPLSAVKKAMFYYVERVYMEAETKLNRIEITMEKKDSSIDFEAVIKEFLNDCLRESLRFEVASETKNIRELIIGRALYSSCIKIDEKIVEKEDNQEEKGVQIPEEQDFDIEDIAVNWFDKNGENKE